MLRPADFLPLIGDRPPYRAPGDRWQYSNAGYVLLGLVIEEVSGRPYTEFVQERVFDRAQMSSSGFFRFDDARPDSQPSSLRAGRAPSGDSWSSSTDRTRPCGLCDRVTRQEGSPTSHLRHLVPRDWSPPHLVAIANHRGGRRDRIRVLIRVLEFAHQAGISSIRARFGGVDETWYRIPDSWRNVSCVSPAFTQ
jgi:CubicO group peptidase (beta-lactamase class C family)